MKGSRGKTLKYIVDENIIFMVKSYVDNHCVCTTYDKALQKNSVPCQAVAYRLNVARIVSGHS